jgi:hypothetical protein
VKYASRRRKNTKTREGNIRIATHRRDVEGFFTWRGHNMIKYMAWFNRI